jgi:hypothetical protein
MSGIETMMSIIKVEGEVMLHDGNSGWVRAHAGMVFPANTRVTIKTGLSGRADIINTRGELVTLPHSSLQVICAQFSASDIGVISQSTLSARDMMSARSMARQRLAPVV